MSNRKQLALEKANNLLEKLSVYKDVQSVKLLTEGLQFVIEKDNLTEFIICFLLPYYDKNLGRFDHEKFSKDKEEKLKTYVADIVAMKKGSVSEEELLNLIESQSLPKELETLLYRYYEYFCKLCSI